MLIPNKPTVTILSRAHPHDESTVISRTHCTKSLAGSSLKSVKAMYPTSQRIAQSTYSLFPDSNRCVPTTKSIPRACTKSIRLPKKSKLLLPAFLSKIFEIFGQAEYTGICGWNADGDTIMITCSEAFIASVLPRFFKHRNFPSFVRQLNLYGFHKTVLDSKRLEFQHPFFKRNRPELLHYIRRKNPVSHPRLVESVRRMHWTG